MVDESSEEQRRQAPGDRRAPPQETSIIEAIRVDLIRLHETWMELIFPRQRHGTHAVLGKWKPKSTRGIIGYRVWGLMGILLLLILYPLAVLGFATRFYTRKIDTAAASLGFVGVIVLSLIVWGALTAATYFSRASFEGFIAVGAAGGVATISAVLALFFTRIDGRFTTVFLAYPFGVTAIFLPPVVAALYSPALADVIFPRSESLAIWILDYVLDYRGINQIIRARFNLEGLAYVAMWFGIAVPVGWILGILVSLANVVRPSGASQSGSATQS